MCNRGETRAKREQCKQRPLRILVVTGIYPTTKHPHVGTFIKSQVDSLIEAGVEVELIHPWPGPALWRYLSAIFQVFCKTLSGRFDVLHGHYGQWCLFARMQWRTPVVASFLGDDLLGTITVEKKYSRQGEFIVRLSRWLCRHVDAVIVKSEGMRKAASGSQMFVIPNGVDFTLFRPIPRSEVQRALGWDQNCCYVLFGNNPAIPVKNFRMAQTAIEYLRTKGMHVELVVACGLPQATLVHYINACNAVILPSYAEGSPNIVKEAMACNVPVVATDVGDVAQVIGRTQGCSVCSHDPSELALALEKAFAHGEPTSGRDDIAHLERSVVARQIIAIYKHVQHRHDQ
jgi:teichuronic acid biosynthesis glycosyltransferase TuaC